MTYGGQDFRQREWHMEASGGGKELVMSEEEVRSQEGRSVVMGAPAT